MDELLSDFVGGACRLYGLKTVDVLPYWTPGRWEMDEPLSRASGSVVTLDSFWRRIDETPGFWHYLDELPWVDQLVDLVTEFSERHELARWHVVTSPGRDPGCYLGKATWLKRKFGRDFDRFTITPHKELYAQPGVVLIDDRESNVDAFRTAGGSAILFPCHHNRLWRLKDDPLTHVTRQLEILRCT